MGDKYPLVSVIIPGYNCANYITETLESVYNQTYQNWEIIFIDDGSTDQTAKVLDPYMDRITYFYQDNKGTAGARNAGIQKAHGELLAFLDNDDLWRPEKLELQVDAMQAHPDVALVFTDGVIFSGDEIVQSSVIAPRLRDWMAIHGNRHSRVFVGSMAYEFYLQNFITSASAVLIRKACVDDVGGFDEKIRIADDYDLWLRIAQHYRIAFLSCRTYMWRCRSSSQSGPLEQRGYVWGIAAARVLEKHLSAASQKLRTIISKSLADLYFSCGYTLFAEEDFQQSRKHFLRSLHYKRLHIRSCFYLLFSYMNPILIRMLRHIKQQMSLRLSTRKSFLNPRN